MRRLLFFIPALLALSAGCATTGGGDGEADRLRAEYETLEAEEAAIEVDLSALSAQMKELFEIAGKLEKERLGDTSESFVLLPKDMPLPGQGAEVGPLEFQKKEATFRIFEYRKAESTIFEVYHVRVVPE